MNKEKLFDRLADISNSMLPLVDFFNDIEQIEDKDYNKEQAYKDIEKICDVVEQLLEDNKRKEKLEKVWEIVKRKEISVFYILDSKNLEDYNDKCDYFRSLSYLTETEFNLLKEMLGEKQ